MNEMNNCIVQDVLRYIIQQCKRHWQKWFSPCTPVSSINKTDCHDITEILLKVALYTINLNHRQKFFMHIYLFYNSSSWHIFCDIVTRVSVISFESFVISFFLIIWHSIHKNNWMENFWKIINQSRRICSLSLPLCEFFFSWLLAIFVYIISLFHCQYFFYMKEINPTVNFKNQ